MTISLNFRWSYVMECFVCVAQFQPHRTWMDETMGTTGEWEYKHMDDKVKGTYPSLCHTRVRPIQPAVSFCHPYCVCVCHSTRGGVRLIEWVNGCHTQHGWQREMVCTHVYVMDLCDPHSGSHSPIHVFFVFCVLPSFNRGGGGGGGGYGWLDSAGWMGSTRNMDGRGNGRQKGGYIPFFLTCLCATPIQPALLSAIHVLCVWSPFNQRKEEYGWLNGHHTQHRWKRQGVRLVEWVHTWMTERMDMYPSFCHSRVRPRFSQPHPSLCFCVWPLFNRRRSMEGWMGTTNSVDERDKGVWLVEWGQTHG